MREYTEKDVHTWDHNGQPFYKLYTDVNDLVYAPLDWQMRGLQQTATGYGRKLTTPNKINFEGKLYRIYLTQYSNVGSAWFLVRGRKIFVS